MSTCALEHIKNWKEAISNMKRICKQNGIILIIVPSDWPFHEHPHDFWRYKKEDITNIFSDCDILTLEENSPATSLVYLKIKQSLVYAKVRKPDEFIEKDLSHYQLYSVVTNKRISEIHDKDFQNFYFRRTKVAHKQSTSQNMLFGKHKRSSSVILSYTQSASASQENKTLIRLIPYYYQETN